MNNKIPYDLGSLSFSLGCIPLLFLAKLPSIQNHYFLLVILLIIIIIYGYIKKQFIRIIGFLLVGFLWSTNSASNYLISIESYIDQKIAVVGTVKSINLGQNIIKDEQNQYYIHFDVQSINQQTLRHSVMISLLWTDAILPFAGEEWQLNVKTKVIHSYLNEGGFDSQRYAIANRQLLSGKIEQAHRVQDNHNVRQYIVDKMLPYANLFEYGDIMLALAFGERSRLTEPHKTVMFQTGIAHLMAISGMHIILVVYFCNRLMRGLQYFLPIRFIFYWVPLLTGFCVAGFYAWLSGLNPPVIRAMLALLLWLLLRHKKISLSPWQIINRIIALLLLFDPLMILAESFWLSCYAVICLVFITQWFSHSNKMGKKPSYLFQLLKLQFILSLLLLPIQFFIFNGTSGIAIIANLIAIPIISFITFPAILVMLILSMFDCFYSAIWFGVIAEQSLSGLFMILEPLSYYWIDIPAQFYLFSSFGWIAIIIWQTGIWRKYILSLLLILMCMVAPLIKQNDEEWRLDMLDVGHGLAMVIRKGQSAILYDTGAKWQNSSAAQRIIIPFLKWHDLTVEGIIISHEHDDHIGGLSFIQQQFPDAWLMSSSARLDNDYICKRGQELLWHDLNLSILWPENISLAAFNAESCVVKISFGKHSVLLTGDLERPQEESLVLISKNKLFSTILQMPHHGSNTSSYYTFLSHVKPDIALGSVSRYNPWKLPSYKALSRYKDLNIDYFLTQSSGQISVFFYTNNWRIKQMRYEIKPRWYHDWFGALPNYG